MIWTWTISLRLMCLNIWHLDNGAIWGDYGTFGTCGLTGEALEAGLWRLYSLLVWSDLSASHFTMIWTGLPHIPAAMTYHDRQRPSQTLSQNNPFLPRLLPSRPLSQLQRSKVVFIPRPLGLAWVFLSFVTVSHSELVVLSLFLAVLCPSSGAGVVVPYLLINSTAQSPL